MVSVDNVRSVLNILNVGDLQDRWGNGGTGANESVDDLRSFLEERVRRNVMWKERSGWGPLFQRQNRRRREPFESSRSSRVLSGDENSAVARVFRKLHVPAGVPTCYVMTFPER